MRALCSGLSLFDFSQSRALLVSTVSPLVDQTINEYVCLSVSSSVFRSILSELVTLHCWLSFYLTLFIVCSLPFTLQFGPYETYAGSPVSKGVLQFDMWNVKPTDRWDWGGLRQKIAAHGVRNSLLVVHVLNLPDLPDIPRSIFQIIDCPHAHCLHLSNPRQQRVH